MLDTGNGGKKEEKCESRWNSWVVRISGVCKNEIAAVGLSRTPEILLVQNSNVPQERYSTQKSGFEILTIRRSVILL